MAKTIGACVKDEKGNLLPYTVQSTKSSCEDYCYERFISWDKLKELGCEIVQVEIIEV